MHIKKRLARKLDSKSAFFVQVDYEAKKIIPERLSDVVEDAIAKVFNNNKLIAPFKDGNYIKEGTPLYSNVVSVSGYVNLDKDNSEVIIKPGELYQLSDSNCLFDTTNRFVEENFLKLKIHR